MIPYFEHTKIDRSFKTTRHRALRANNEQDVQHAKTYIPERTCTEEVDETEGPSAGRVRRSTKIKSEQARKSYQMQYVNRKKFQRSLTEDEQIVLR